MRTVQICVLAVLTTCGFPALGAFKCTDEKGRTHFEDTLPDACANVVTYELSRSGTVIRTIEPTRAKVDDSGARQQAAQDAKASVERKRRDAVLLDSYGSERELDAARDRNLDMLKNRLSAARTTAQKAQQREKEVQRQVDSKGRAVPAVLAADLEHARSERATADATLARIEKDLAATQARFAADKARWIELRATK